MKRTTALAYLGALVLASQSLGCVNEGAFPDDSVLEDESAERALEDALPARLAVSVPARDDVLAQWQLPASSPWEPYEKLTLPSVLSDKPQLLLLPDVERIEDVRVARMAAERVARDGLPRGTAWFVDLPGAASVAFAETLARYARVPVAAVPTFNNWPAANELVPAEETLAAMIANVPRQPTEEASALPLFLLDAWRLAYKSEEIPGDVVDNRYMLTPGDFPTAAVLRAHGIAEVVYLVESDQVGDEEDDLMDLFASYEDAGIVLHYVTLDSIVQEHETWEPSWYVSTWSRYTHVRRRLTVVHDPLFYRRSHGGFGGAHMVPTAAGHIHMGFFGAHGGG